MRRGLTGTAREACAFLRAGRIFWSEIVPILRTELRIRLAWAKAIPSPELRRDALHSLRRKWGHSEGAAAFAILAPPGRRAAVARLAIACEVMMDYLDTLSERPAADPYANTLQLHRSLLAGLALERPPPLDYYELCPCGGEDGGYLRAHVDLCSRLLAALPAHRQIDADLRRFGTLYAEAQGICHAIEADTPVPPAALSQAGCYAELAAGDMRAACSSSLPVMALFAAAARPAISEASIASLGAAYYPWTSALHILLDGLLDRSADRANGQYNQLGHYASIAEAAARIELIATRSRRLLAELPQAEAHLALLAGMAGYYLAPALAWHAEAAPLAAGASAPLGPLVKPAVLVHRLRQKT